MKPTLENTHMRSLISPVHLAKEDQVVGTVFYKQLFTYGTWINPNWWWDEELTMELTKELAEEMVDNFNKNTLGDPVAVPLNHTGDVTANTGRVLKLEAGDDGLYGYLDIRRPNVVDDINNGLIFGVSIGFDWDYVSQKDGSHHGATIYHVALVTEPYINNTTGFVQTEESELSKALDRRHQEFANHLTVAGKRSVIMMSKGNVEELKKEIQQMGKAKLSKVTNDQDFPVEVTHKDEDDKDVTVTLQPGQEIEVPESEAEAVTKTISEATKPEDSEEETDEERQAREEQEAKDANEATEETPEQELSRLRAEKVDRDAEHAYETLLNLGKIVPAQKEKFMALAKSNTQVQLAKDKKVSIVELMSDIFKAAPTQVSYDEKGGAGNDAGEAVKLSKEDERTLAKLGVKPEAYAKQVAAGKVKPINSEEE